MMAIATRHRKPYKNGRPHVPKTPEQLEYILSFWSPQQLEPAQPAIADPLSPKVAELLSPNYDRGVPLLRDNGGDRTHKVQNSLVSATRRYATNELAAADFGTTRDNGVRLRPVPLPLSASKIVEDGGWYPCILVVFSVAWLFGFPARQYNFIAFLY